MTALELAIEIIGQAIYDYMGLSSDKNKAEVEAVDALVSLASTGYTMITFPEIQDYMEEPWFKEECYLVQAFEDQPHFDSAYFVPIARVLK